MKAATAAAASVVFVDSGSGGGEGRGIHWLSIGVVGRRVDDETLYDGIGVNGY